MARSSQAKRAGWAAFFGNAVEWYDFFIFGTASALVLAPLFFPNADGATGILYSFATFGVGYVARPLGGIIFGHLGDRMGRKRSLIITISIMGVATVGIGLLPTHHDIGITASVLLVVLRLIQGLAVGGEWGGAVLIASEHSSKKNRVAAGGWAQQGAPAGNLMASGAFLLVAGLPDDQFMSWGWRLPFIFSAVLIIIGLVIRSKVEESPELVEALKVQKASKERKKVPIVEVLRTAPVILLLGCCVGAASNSFGTFFKVLGLDYATNDVGMDRQGFLLALTFMSIFQFVFQPLAALASMRFEPIKIIRVALVLSVVLAPVSWLCIGTGSVAVAAIGMMVSLAPICWMFGLLGGFLSEAFETSVRYTGISTAQQFNTLIFVAPVPLVGGALLLSTGSIWSVIFLQMGLGVISMIATLWISRTTGAGKRDNNVEETSTKAVA